MKSLIPDHAQRQEALNPRASFIVQAPAGSGKTELLIQRFLVLLARVEVPEAIVAITFTRKAAAEMRHRIISALQSAIAAPPVAQHERHTWGLAREALEHNDQKKWHLLDNPLRLRIQTIDSLCSLLVRRMPWVSRMGALLKPEENAAHLHQKAARRTLELLFSNRKVDAKEPIVILLRHLDNHMGRLETLLGAMLGSRDQWMRHVDVGETELTAVRAELESALSSVVQRTLDCMVEKFPKNYADEIAELARFAASNLRDNGRENYLEDCLELDELPGASIEELPKWLGTAELLLTRGGQRRKRYTIREGFPPSERDAKDRIKNVHLEEDVRAQLHALRELPPISYEEGQWEVLAALMHLLPEAVIQLRTVFQEEGCVDFTEISMAAQQAIKMHVSSGTYGPIPDMEIQHLLVDEFQDTSQSQYELLERLIHNWDDDDRTLFLVGDPMQSIYGFREAEVGLFSRTCTVGLGRIRPRSLVLETNFRSSTEIVDWVNEALGDAFPKEEDLVTGGVSYSPSTAHRTDLENSMIRAHPFFFNDLEGQAKKVVEIIEETRVQQPDATIAVLVQARNHLLHIIALLHRREIAFRSVEIDPLSERPAVHDLMALTQALLHLGNRIAWLSVLRAPWCGLKLTDLQALVDDDFNTAIYDLLLTGKERLSSDGRRRLDRIIPILNEACMLRGRLPVRRWVEGIWLALGGPACLETKAELEDAMTYLDLLEESVDGSGLRDEKKFMEDVQRLFAPSDVEAGDELQLLTIHKAKGLEFDTVILPGLGYQTRRDDPRLLMWREYNDGHQSNLLLAPIRQTGGKEDGVYRYLQTIERNRRGHESTRLLYVAATRARRNLHLVGHVKQNLGSDDVNEPPLRSLLSKIWDTVQPEFLDQWTNRQQKEGEEDGTGRNQLVGVPLLRLSTEWVPVDPHEELIWQAKREQSEDEKEDREVIFEWVGDTQRRVGIVVHRILQQMWAPDRLDFSERVLRDALYHEGLHEENLEKALVQVKYALKNTAEDRRGRWILSKHESDEREYALTSAVGDSVRRFILDRTFVEDGVRWIVDYKTSTHSGSDVDRFLDNEQQRYESKMQAYAQAMRAIDSRRIFLGLYFPVLRGWREWEYVDSENA